MADACPTWWLQTLPGVSGCCTKLRLLVPRHRAIGCRWNVQLCLRELRHAVPGNIWHSYSYYSFDRGTYYLVASDWHVCHATAPTSCPNCPCRACEDKGAPQTVKDVASWLKASAPHLQDLLRDMCCFFTSGKTNSVSRHGQAGQLTVHEHWYEMD